MNFASSLRLSLWHCRTGKAFGTVVVPKTQDESFVGGNRLIKRTILESDALPMELCVAAPPDVTDERPMLRSREDFIFEFHVLAHDGSVAFAKDLDDVTRVGAASEILHRFAEVIKGLDFTLQHFSLERHGIISATIQHSGSTAPALADGVWILHSAVKMLLQGRHLRMGDHSIRFGEEPSGLRIPEDFYEKQEGA